MISPREAFELLRTALEAAGVRFAIGGSWASTAFGEPRFSNGVDILAVVSCSLRIGFCSTGISEGCPRRSRLAFLRELAHDKWRELMSSQVIASNTEAAILSRLIQSREDLTTDAAEYLLSINFEPYDVERMNLLSERASAGTLTSEEEKELDSYLHVGSLLSIMQSRARRRLKSADSVYPHL